LKFLFEIDEFFHTGDALLIQETGERLGDLRSLGDPVQDAFFFKGEGRVRSGRGIGPDFFEKIAIRRGIRLFGDYDGIIWGVGSSGTAETDHEHSRGFG